MALMAALRPEEEQALAQARMAAASPSVIQHPMHAMTAPISAPPPDLSSIQLPDDSTPDIGGMSPQPKVRQMSPLERYQEKVGSRMSEDLQKDANPYGSANNHPGFFGKLLHGLSVATGGPNRREFEEDQLGRQLQDIETESNNEALKKAQTQNLESEVRARENPEQQPQERPYTISTDKGMLQFDPATEKWMPIEVNGEVANAPQKEGATHPFQHVAGTSAGKHIFANYDPSSGRFTDLQGNILSDFTPTDKSMQGAFGGFGPAFLAYRMLNSAYNENPHLLPYIAPLISKMLAQSGAGNVPGMTDAIGSIPTGQPQDENGQAIGLRMPGAPTGATRSRGQFAESVLPDMQDAQNQVTALGNELGPLSGRWTDFFNGKVGTDNPRFTGLRTSLHNIATAWMRLHANSDSARKDFIDMLNASQSPANLIANLNSIETQARNYVQEGKGRPATQAQAWSAPEGAPSAPKEDGKYLYQDGKAVAKSQGGKWVKP